jgi:hypothetical protein
MGSEGGRTVPVGSIAAAAAAAAASWSKRPSAFSSRRLEYVIDGVAGTVGGDGS